MKALITAALLASSAALAAESPAVLGQLEARGRVIIIWAGEQPRYTVRAKDGQTLAEGLTLRQLSAKYPELRSVVDGSYATWAGL